MENTKHTSKDKKCPTFIKHKELQAIKTTLKVDNKAALKIYNERHQHDGSLYSSAANNSNIQAVNNHVKFIPTQTTATTSSTANANNFKEPASKRSFRYDTLTDSESDLQGPPTASKDTTKRMQLNESRNNIKTKLTLATHILIHQKNKEKATKRKAMNKQKTSQMISNFPKNFKIISTQNIQTLLSLSPLILIYIIFYHSLIFMVIVDCQNWYC